MIEKVRKAIFPAAGLGTRFLPATKSIPKAMLPIIDRPVIEYAVEEARAAGIECFIFVVGPRGRAIEEHFNPAKEIACEVRNRRHVDASGSNASHMDTYAFARQPSPLGLGHAIWCARDLLDDEPFAVVTPDVITRGEPGCLTQVLATYYSVGGNVLSVEECRPDQTSRYGIVGVGEPVSDVAFRVTAMVEKPQIGSAPSSFKISGRYILQPRILDHLAKQEAGVGGEIQLTDALIRLAEEQPIFGHRFQGRSFDCGSREGYVAANVAFALDDPQLAEVVRRELDLTAR